MALPILQRMNGFRVPNGVDSRTRKEMFIDCSLQNELAEIRRLFSRTVAGSVLQVMADEQNKKKLCFGCEMADDSESIGYCVLTGANHICNMDKSKLFLGCSSTIWGMLNEQELKEQWFKAMEKSRRATKQGILRFFQAHFEGCKVEYMKPESQKEIVAWLDRAK